MKRTPRFYPRKSLGQHFLEDPRKIQEIITKARFEEDDEVLEVGSGLGALTLPLARHVKRIIAVEKDLQLVEMLRKKLVRPDIDNVTLIHADILTLDFSELISPHGRSLYVIGNLPYNISSPLLEKLVRSKALIKRAVLTFQLELAKRLVASPGNRDYGAMTILVQYHAHLSPLLQIPREAFYPRPKVGSMVLELDFTKPHPTRTEDEENFRKVVKAGFAHRRKTIINSLSGTLTALGRERINQALEQCGIDPFKRAEMLGIDDFLCLSGALKACAESLS